MPYIPRPMKGGSSHGARSGPCDAALAYAATRASVAHKWILYSRAPRLVSPVAESAVPFTNPLAHSI
jgi:hypothetical protein